ncbi:MAG: segregation and condensation protein A [Caldicoprobacterales bacterium]|jgi:segregation and condensation protein A|nr:segregation/condensation protein A [Clostridiales bacterium]
MSYVVKLDQFEGPLDLLLHLISKAKVKIEDVSITEITEQYLEMLHLMEKFDIEIASEFLVMAATLLHIKSCILVPRVKPELEEDDEADPKQELITRLLEYKKYKEAASRLKEREAYFSGMYYKLPEEIVTKDTEDVLTLDTSIALLQDALCKLLQTRPGSRVRTPLIHEIKRDPITVNEKVNYLKDYFTRNSRISFFGIFEDIHDREEIIVTFLALLELLSNNFIEVKQDIPFGDIVMKRRVSNG